MAGSRRNNYYICRANALETNVVLYKVVGGKRSALDIVGCTGDYGVSAPARARDWNHLRLEFSGPTNRVIFNGAHLFDVADTTFTNAGMVGLWTKPDVEAARKHGLRYIHLPFG